MKRVFCEADASIPESIWNQFPHQQRKLQRIAALEDTIDSLLMSNLRTKFAINSEREIKQKILRVFLHHTFVPPSADDKGHFLLLLEGHVLDDKYRRSVPIGAFFDKIRYIPDINTKRANAIDRACEWTVSAFPEGQTADCFRAKIYLDKATNIKLFLHRRSTLRPRYEISLKLRSLLPYIQIDPTEDDVMMAVWHYLIQKNLFIDGRERKVIRCDDLLKDVCGVDSLLLSTLKAKICEHLLPCKPIQVDYMLSMTDTHMDERYRCCCMCMPL